MGIAIILIASFGFPLLLVGYSADSTDIAIPTPIEVDVSEFDFNSLVSHYSMKYGVSETVALSLMNCESEFDPNAENPNFDEEGVHWSTDYGYWQLNDYHQEETMANMGWDIRNPQDNLEAGFWLLSTAGTTPWGASNPCHGL